MTGNAMREARAALERHPRCGAHARTTGERARHQQWQMAVAECTVARIAVPQRANATAPANTVAERRKPRRREQKLGPCLGA